MLETPACRHTLLGCHRGLVNVSKVDKKLKIHRVAICKYQSSLLQWRLKENAHKPARALKPELYIFEAGIQLQKCNNLVQILKENCRV